MVAKKQPAKSRKKAGRKGVGTIELAESIKPQPEQAEFEGMETPAIPEVEKKAREHGGYKDKAKPLNDKAKESKAQLITLMIQHDLKTYNRHGIHIQITESLDAKVEID